MRQANRIEPSLTLTLADALAKRLDWLEEVAEDLGLEGVSTLHGRAEDFGNDPNLRETFDLVTARGVSQLSLLSELCLPLTKVGGEFLAMKASDYLEEVEGAKTGVETLGGRIRGCPQYQIPNLEVERYLIRIQKLAPTPDRYPRRWAKMQKSPL